MALVEARSLSFAYPNRGSRSEPTWALADVDLTIERGDAVGIVGESGSGKSTLVRVLMGLLDADRGSASFDGRAVQDWLRVEPSTFRRRNQMIFQSPASSFDPRMTLGRSLQEPVRALERRRPRIEEVRSWAAAVHLDPGLLERFPHQVSGGQLQRAAIARALSIQPDVLYADEPTSALDVSIQAQILNLLMELRERYQLTVVLVSHDLAVIGRICESVIVMNGGKVVESASATEILTKPRQDYTRDLVAAGRAVSLGYQDPESSGRNQD